MSETLVQAVMLATVAAIRSLNLQRDVFDFKLFVEKGRCGLTYAVMVGLSRDHEMGGE